MEPKKVGRTLGIGVRVASNMLRERVERAAAAHSAPAEAGNGSPTASPRPRASIKIDSKVASAKRGVKAFGRAFLGPFTHAGSILWLEITGLFFALFALFFVQSALSRARRLVAGPGTCAPAALRWPGCWFRLVFGQLVQPCVPQEQTRPRFKTG